MPRSRSGQGRRRGGVGVRRLQHTLLCEGAAGDRPFARSRNWSSTSSSWRSSRMDSICVPPRWATIPTPPCSGFAGPQPDSLGDPPRLRPGRLERSGPSPPVRGPLPVRQDAQRRRADHALRPPGNAAGPGDQATLQPRCHRHARWTCPGLLDRTPRPLPAILKSPSSFARPSPGWP